MDLDELRTILGNSGVNIWELLETGIKLACLDYKQEIALHRDRIVAQLYAICPNCDNHDDTRVRASTGNVNVNGNDDDNVGFEAGFGVDEEGYNKVDSPYTPVSIGGGDEIEGEHVHSKQDDQMFVDEENDDDEYDEETRIVHIKEQIDDPHQSEESLVDLLQTLADMDITFKALKETDIGRHVNRLRKHPSNDVKRLVKLLVRKWKDLVDDWVRSNGPVDGSSPQQNVSKNHNMVPDFGYSPNPHNGSSGSDKSEYKPKAVSAHVTPPGRMTPVKPIRAASPASAPLPYKQKEVAIDPERFASARKRLQENYQEAQNAKKQRTIQVMDIHELPKGKAKNSFFGRNKGGFQRH